MKQPKKKNYYRDQMLLALLKRRVYKGILTIPDKIILFNIKPFDSTV